MKEKYYSGGGTLFTQAIMAYRISDHRRPYATTAQFKLPPHPGNYGKF